MSDIIITNLSIHSNNPERTYFSDIGDITGKDTNDAPVKYLIGYIRSLGRDVDKIVVVQTPQAANDYELFCDMVKPLHIDPERQLIPVEDIEGKMDETIRKISRNFQSGDSVYIDTTGSYRNSSYLLMITVRMLEYSGARLEKAVYSKLERENGVLKDTGQIEDVTYLYNMFDLINSAYLFTSSGSSHGLEQYFAETSDQTVRETISAMNEFSDMISLCRTSELEKILERLNRSLTSLTQVSHPSMDIALFQNLIATIREKFHTSAGQIEFPDVVRWCLDNRLIQQAVTIYVEKMPEYFRKKGIFSATPQEDTRVLAASEKSNFGYYYELFYNNFLKLDVGCPLQMLLKTAANGSKNKPGHTGSSFSLKGSSMDGALLSHLSDCADYITFANYTSSKSFAAYGLSEMSAPLKKFFRLKNSLYTTEGDRRKPDDLSNRMEKNCPEIWDIMKDKTNLIPRSTEGFIRTISTNHEVCAILSGIDTTVQLPGQLALIEGLPGRLKGTQYTVSAKLPAEQVRSIFRDIFYAKTFIRNRMNHAGDEDTSNADTVEYFRSHGYCVDSDLTAQQILDFMNQAISKL